MRQGPVSASFFNLFFFCFIALLFLSLGVDTPAHVQFRMGYGGLLLVGAALLFPKDLKSGLLQSPAALCFFLFVGFELVRLLWTGWEMALGGLRDTPALPLNRYLSSPWGWIISFAFLILSLSRFKDRSEAGKLLWVLAGCGFVLALNAIPSLLMTGKAGYLRPDGRMGFFYPLFYFHPLAERYLLGTFAYPNHTGDLVAVGFYAGLALLLYFLQGLKEKKGRRGEGLFESVPAGPLGLIFAMVALAAAAVVLFFSRGAILCFIFSLVLYLSIFLFRSASRTGKLLALAAFILIVGFTTWLVDLGDVWKEIQTLRHETAAGAATSFSTNREAAKRALAIHRLSPLWGVGTEGYESVSRFFATPGTENMTTAEYRAMSHYLTLLAEEGAGAYFYFFFLLAYFFEVFRGMLKVKSRFRMTAALSLSVAVLMILAHASITNLMQQFSVSMLVYILMGASLGVLREQGT